MPLVLGVDSSTQSCKVEIRDADTGLLVAAGRAPHPPTTPPCSEQDPAAWWSALVAATEEAQAKVPSGGSVAALAVAGQQHGMVVTDTEGAPLRPAKLWNDTESDAHASALVDMLGAAEWATATGSVPVAAFTVAKVAWLAEHEPSLLERIAHLLLPHDWLTLRLTGRAVTDRGDASGTGYFDPVRDEWRPDLLHLAAPAIDTDGWAHRLPQVLGPLEPAGPLTVAAAHELGLGEATLVAAGTGDNMAAALGLGLQSGDIAISLGTSGTVYAVSERPTSDASGAVAGFADATGMFLPLVCTLNATQVTDVVARWLGVDAQQLADMALAAEPGSSGVVLVPYLAGERTPNRPHARGLMEGLHLGTTADDLARAAHEGVVCGLLDGLDALVSAGVTADAGRLLVLGGGSRSTAYPQILADLAGRTVTVAEGDEHVATGACVQAAACLSGTSPHAVADAWGLGAGSDVGPDPDARPDAIRAAYAHARDTPYPG